MIRSNSKKAVENIRKYIIENVDLENYSPKYDYIIAAREEVEKGNKNIDLFSMIKEAIKEVVYTEKIKLDRRPNMTLFDYFEEWASGLPSFLDCDYYYHLTAVKILGDILEETEEERRNYDEFKAEKRLTQLLFREIYK